MNTTDYLEQIRKLQAELDIVTKECNEWKDKFERTLLWQKQTRLPSKSVHLDCIGSSQGKASIQTYTTIGWQDGDDGR